MMSSGFCSRHNLAWVDYCPFCNLDAKLGELRREIHSLRAILDEETTYVADRFEAHRRVLHAHSGRIDQIAGQADHLDNAVTPLESRTEELEIRARAHAQVCRACGGCNAPA
jgi:hypothetical protein